MKLQPVRIHGDFVNCAVELTSEQLQQVVSFAKELHNSNLDKD